MADVWVDWPLGERIKAWRQVRQMSLQQAADAIGISKPHLWELEQGTATNPTLETLRGIAKLYGVTVAEVIGEQPLDWTRGWNDAMAYVRLSTV